MANTRADRPRVVVLGASSMRLPWNANVTHVLQRRMPHVEFINLSAEGMSLANIARLSQESAVLSPDAVLIYAGHNEYNSTVFHGRIQGTRLWMLPVYGLLARSWIHGALTRAPRFIQRDTNARPRALLATTDDTAQQLRAAIDQRLYSDLRLAADVSPAPVILSTLLRNPASRPTGVLTTGRPACAEHLSWFRTDRGQGLRTALPLAEAHCGESSITWWLRARIALEDGRTADAEQAWKASLALDALPLRAPLHADDLIREVAAETGSTLVDLEAQVGMFPPSDWFTDTLHLNQKGAEQLAIQLQPTITSVLER